MTQSIGPPSLAQGTRIAVGFSTSISRFIPACGELSKPSWAIVQLDGSSPLTRGTHSSLLREFLCTRFIPAYAGNSCLSTIPKCSLAVHPRLRGELGSLHSKFQGIAWFIPAYAGNSKCGLPPRNRSSVHPRLRGELACDDTVKSVHDRFIPAYAGNSRTRLKCTAD